MRSFVAPRGPLFVSAVSHLVRFVEFRGNVAWGCGTLDSKGTRLARQPQLLVGIGQLYTT